MQNPVRLASLALFLALLLLSGPPPAQAGGALNPEPDEYYTLYCGNDQLEVWRSTPSALLLATVPMVSLLDLVVGSDLVLTEGMTVARVPSETDTLTVSGSNGNAAPAAGVKSFSLSECIARNGGVPELPDEQDPPPPTVADIECRVSCDECALCLLDLDECVESPSLPGYDPYCYLDLVAGCPVLCLEICDGLPLPGGTPGNSRRSPAPRRAPSPPDPASSGLALFRAVRDRVLEATPKGRRFRDLYYAQQDEILPLLVSNWGRWHEGLSTLVRFQPHLLALVEGRGAEATISAADVAVVEAFLDHLASPASPELQSVLATERSEAQLAQLVGRTMEEARRILIGAASCPAAPDPACTTGFAKGSLRVDERKAGKEKLVARLSGGPAIAQADFGDPTAATLDDVSLCIYDDAGALAAPLGVARAGESCGRRPCWKALGKPAPAGKGFAYKDKLGLADGLRSIVLKGGAAGKSSLAASAANQARRRQTHLPDGIGAALSATSSVTMQLRAGGGCFSTELADVVKQEPGLFQAR